jgi:hypothetical protein
MSSHLEVYIGVYLVVDQWVEGSYMQRFCEEDHKQRTWSHSDDNKFCGICGTPVSDKPVEYKNRISLQDADDLFDIEVDTFQEVEQGDKPPIWISNLTAENLVQDDANDREITPEYIEAAVARFQHLYEKELQALDDNDVDYKMHFGFVPYYN